MKVARLHGASDLRLADEAEPVPGPGDCLVRVTAVGLCGSDLHWWTEGGIGDARLHRRIVRGHEFAGVIVDGLGTGLRVAVDPANPCNGCDVCRAGNHNLCPAVAFAGHADVDGALREYLTWPAELLVPLPDGVSDVDGALLEPLGVALHAFALGHVRAGWSVGVFGCGPIGLMLVRLARLAGAGLVVASDPLAHRRDAALRYGADAVWDPAGELDVDLGVGVDVAFEGAGAGDAGRGRMGAVRPGAKVVLVGIPDADTTSFPAALARRKGLSLVLSRRMNDTYPRAIRLVERGDVDLSTLVTARFPLDQASDAFAVAVARTGLKTVITP